MKYDPDQIITVSKRFPIPRARPPQTEIRELLVQVIECIGIKLNRDANEKEPHYIGYRVEDDTLRTTDELEFFFESQVIKEDE